MNSKKMFSYATRRFSLVSRNTLLYLDRFSVIEDIVTDHLDNTRTYTYLDKPNAVGIIPVMDSKILLVEQYRHSVGKRLLEIPGGLIEKGESPSEAARRELNEEIGFKAKSLHYLMETYPLPSISNEKITIYYSENLEKDIINRDKNEIDMKLMPIAIHDIIKILQKGIISSSSDELALYKYIHLRHPHLI